MTNLWPSDITDLHDIETPLDILQEQAGELGQLTQNKVMGSIVMVDPTRIYNTGRKSADFNFEFYIEAPSLDNYSYRLFTISHLVTLYPVTIHMSSSLAQDIKRESSGDSVVAEDKKDFLGILKEIFAAQTTKQLIAILLKQSGFRLNDDDMPF